MWWTLGQVQEWECHSGMSSGMGFVLARNMASKVSLVAGLGCLHADWHACTAGWEGAQITGKVDVYVLDYQPHDRACSFYLNVNDGIQCQQYQCHHSIPRWQSLGVPASNVLACPPGSCIIPTHMLLQPTFLDAMPTVTVWCLEWAANLQNHEAMVLQNQKGRLSQAAQARRAWVSSRMSLTSHPCTMFKYTTISHMIHRRQNMGSIYAAEYSCNNG